MNQPTTLIFTNSYDVTTDWVLRQLPDSLNGQIFRFNFDLFEEYDLLMTPDGFTLGDPAGRIITLSDVVKAYFRKPAMRKASTMAEDYVETEKWAIFRALIYLVWEQRRLVLVEPFCEKTRLNKLRQLRFAEGLFHVPQTIFTNKVSDHLPEWDSTIVKSLTGGNLGDRTLYTTQIDPAKLDPAYPWYLQEYVHADFDLTTVFVRGKLFTFRLERSFIEETIDFRQPEESWGNWEPFDAGADFDQAVCTYMERLNLDYGRLDFLQQSDGTIAFCEVNPNGQYAWLDKTDEKTGLLSTIANEISPDTPVYPIPTVY